MRSGTVNAPRLIEICEDRELTATQLAALVSEQLGRRVDPGTIYKIMRGVRQPSAQMFGAICRALKCRKNDLLIRTEVTV